MKKIIVTLFCVLIISSCGSNAVEQITEGAVEVYSEQQLKARDSQRIVDLNIIQRGILEYFMEYETYPESLEDEKFLEFLDGNIPVDIIDGEEKNGCTFGYQYEPDNENMNYRLSTCFEFYADKAQDDWGIYDDRFEHYGY